MTNFLARFVYRIKQTFTTESAGFVEFLSGLGSISIGLILLRTASHQIPSIVATFYPRIWNDVPVLGILFLGFGLCKIYVWTINNLSARKMICFIATLLWLWLSTLTVMSTGFFEFKWAFMGLFVLANAWCYLQHAIIRRRKNDYV